MKANIIQTLTLCFVLLAAPLSAAAFTPEGESAEPPAIPIDLRARTAAWKLNFQKQLYSSLNAPEAGIRSQTLENFIVLVHQHADAVDLSDAAPRLLNIVRHDENEAHRIMAVVALHGIGDARSMKGLKELVRSEPSQRVRHHMLSALVDYYNLHHKLRR